MSSKLFIQPSLSPTWTRISQEMKRILAKTTIKDYSSTTITDTWSWTSTLQSRAKWSNFNKTFKITGATKFSFTYMKPKEGIFSKNPICSHILRRKLRSRHSIGAKAPRASRLFLTVFGVKCFPMSMTSLKTTTASSPSSSTSIVSSSWYLKTSF